jgi:hypothetical protein
MENTAVTVEAKEELEEEILPTGRVYRIVRIADDTKPNPEDKREMYIGATGSELAERMIRHKLASGKDKNYPLHVVMINEGVDNFRIELMKEFTNITRSDLYREEAKLIEQFNTVHTGWNGKFGSPFCVHDCIRKVCKTCDGSAICTHKKRREYCKECKGSAICEHGRMKAYCTPCEGVGICQHYTRRYNCSTCRQCRCCPHSDKVKSADTKKHIGKPKHHYNWRVYQVIWTNKHVQQVVSLEARHDLVLSIMMISDQNRDHLARVVDHRTADCRMHTFAELESMITPNVPLADIPISDSGMIGQDQIEQKRCGRKVTVEFNAPTSHKQECLLKEGRPLNCAFCNPCIACDGTAADTAPHRKTKKHQDNAARVEEMEKLMTIPNATIPPVACHPAHWTKCYKCNRCEICQVPFAKTKGHLESEMHLSYLRVRSGTSA